MKYFAQKKFETCNNKNCYSSKIEAEEVAREQEILHAMDDLELRVYRCVECGQWHLSRVSSSSS